MSASLSAGCPDTDIVLSEAGLTEVITCLAGQTGENLYYEHSPSLIRQCESYDLRVGERASSKRQRSAGNAAQAALDSARGTRSRGRRKEGQPKKGPLPPGWKVKHISIEDGRQYRKYVAPNGRAFNTYGKAQEQWESDKAAARQHPNKRKRGRPPKPAPGTKKVPAADHEEGTVSPSLRQLVEWQRGVAAAQGKTERQQQYFRAIERAQRAILQLRSSRARS